MRLIPIITAVLVTIGLYLAVFERDALLAFALGQADESSAQTTTANAETATEASTPVVESLASSGRTVAVVVQKSTAQVVDNAVILRGETRAARQVEVRSEISATVLSEPLRKGQFVEADDVLCELDSGTRQSALTEARARVSEARSRVPEARARLDEANARLDEAMVNFNAAEKLSVGGFASETRLKSALAAVRAAEAGIASAESGVEASQAGIESATAAVASAEKEIERLTIRAPFRGLLESDTAEIGSLMQPGSLCATVIQLDPIKLVGYVPETEINRIEVGAIAGAELVTGERVTGTVAFLSRSADQTTRTFQVEIDVPNGDLKIRDGQTVTIAIASEGEKAHKLPQSALTLNNDGQIGVRVADETNTVRFNPIRVLRDETTGVWVGGLPETANVIVVGQDFVTEGVRVTPTYREARQ